LPFKGAGNGVDPVLPGAQEVPAIILKRTVGRISKLEAKITGMTPD